MNYVMKTKLIYVWTVHHCDGKCQLSRNLIVVGKAYQCDENSSLKYLMKIRYSGKIYQFHNTHECNESSSL